MPSLSTKESSVIGSALACSGYPSVVYGKRAVIEESPTEAGWRIVTRTEFHDGSAWKEAQVTWIDPGDGRPGTWIGCEVREMQDAPWQLKALEWAAIGLGAISLTLFAMAIKAVG